MARTRFGKWILRVYRALLRLYPPAYRAKFGEEMETTFDDAVEENETNQSGGLFLLLWREVRDLPRALGRAWRSLRPVSMGLLFYAVLGAFLILLELPVDWALNSWLVNSGVSLMWLWIAFPYIGLCTGWIRGFPRWAYPYLGYSLIFSLYMTQVATPGLRFFGYTFGRQDLWGWRAFLPLMLVAVIALLVTRSLRPLANLFTNVWRDWTILSYTLFGFMPLLVLLNFDEMDRLFSLYFMVALAAVMLLSAAMYLTAPTQGRRVFAVVAGILLSVTLTTIGPIAYWLPLNGVNVPGSIRLSLIVTAFLLSPALLGLLRSMVGRLRPA